MTNKQERFLDRDLTDNEVREIRRRYRWENKNSMAELAKEFGVSKRYVRAIVFGQIYRLVPTYRSI